MKERSVEQGRNGRSSKEAARSKGRNARSKEEEGAVARDCPNVSKCVQSEFDDGKRFNQAEKCWNRLAVKKEALTVILNLLRCMYANSFTGMRF